MTTAKEPEACKWCGRETGCDCEDRMACPKAATFGHSQCGTLPCGCPNFTGHLRLICPKRKG